ncbi:TetR/AcrR family transcriptional regulator [Actinocrispum sp. NPDC049592]|uniref:TetR/AcrR family transcriptional regulator n=1 Tax=Actinocrispum sp. NPDC049592 TaxID=3154835 RepID=UPI00344AFCE3
MDTRERLVESTRELLWERGYVGTSPKAIQERSGVGQGSMYHHFAGKTDLALAAIQRTAADLRAAAAADLDGPGSPADRVMAYLRRSREVLRGCPVGRMTQDPDVATDRRLRQPLADTFEWLRGRLAAVLAPALPDGVPAEAIAATILATLQGGYVLARAAGDTEPFDRAIDGIQELLTRTMGG